jgi:hypothetical protein
MDTLSDDSAPDNYVLLDCGIDGDGRCPNCIDPSTDCPFRSERTAEHGANRNGDDQGQSDADCNASLPPIDATVEHLPSLTEAAWDALQAANDLPVLFRFSAIPSRIEADDDGAPMLRSMSLSRMRHRLARVAQWYKRVKRKVRLIAPPDVVVQDVLATPDPPLPVLTRIVEAPVFSPDGILCLEPGYSPDSKSFYAPAPGFAVPPVSPQPTTEEIQSARQLLEELVIDFPFVGDAERAHALAALLVPFVREMIAGPTPFHLIEAPSAGTGKTLLAYLLTYPALGRLVTPMTEGKDEDEWRKRLLAKLRSAPSVVLVDNLKRRLETAALSSAVTSWPLWEDRLLGVSEIIRVPVQCIWLATGNNPALSSEIARRTIRVRLDARVDRPWLREGFRHPEIRSWATANRTRLVWAALTLAQAWIAAGRPEGARPLGMFECWAKVMGGILAVAGIPGFLGNLEEFYEKSDVEGAAWRGFVAAWWIAHGLQDVTVAALWPLAIDAGLDLGDKSEQSQKIRLGKQLMEMRDRTFTVTVGNETKQIRMQQEGTEHRAKLWQLVPVQSPEPAPSATPAMQEGEL